MKILWCVRIFFILPMVIFGLIFIVEDAVKGIGVASVFIFIAYGIELGASMDARQYNKKLKKEKSPENNEALEIFILPKLKEKLNELIYGYRGVITFEALEEIMAMKTNILSILPYLEKLNAGDYDLHNIIKIITDYLPKILMSYSESPSDFIENNKDKTPEDILMEKLTAINSELQTVVNNINHKKLDALLIQGEFLKNKFPKDDWL